VPIWAGRRGAAGPSRAHLNRATPRSRALACPSEPGAAAQPRHRVHIRARRLGAATASGGHLSPASRRRTIACISNRATRRSRKVSQAAVAILAVLDRVFPEFADQFSDPFGTSARELLGRAASAAEFAAFDVEELTTVLERTSRKRLRRDRADAVQGAAADSLGLAALAPTARLEVRALLDQGALLESQLHDVDTAVADLLANVQQHLTSIPGIGPVLAATILAEIGEIERFPRVEALVAYAGLDPSVFASGGFKGTRQHLSNVAHRTYAERCTWLPMSRTAGIPSLMPISSDAPEPIQAAMRQLATATLVLFNQLHPRAHAA
jgi:hypothetical protein